MGTTISSGELAGLVLAATRGTDDAAAALLRAVLGHIDELVCVLSIDAEGLSADMIQNVRVKIVEELAVDLISKTTLAAWAAVPRLRVWRFVEDRTRERTLRALDHAWVLRVAERQDRQSETLLVARVRRLFESAARKRGLFAPERDDAAQEFYLWLIKNHYAALRRWSPDGGRSFDGWFYDRANHHIVSLRRRQVTLQATDESDETLSITPAPEIQYLMKERLQQIQAWLQQHCSKYQLEVFHRWFIEEQSAAEIAAALETTTAAVHVAVSRMRRAILLTFGP